MSTSQNLPGTMANPGTFNSASTHPFTGMVAHAKSNINHFPARTSINEPINTNGIPI